VAFPGMSLLPTVPAIQNLFPVSQHADNVALHDLVSAIEDPEEETQYNIGLHPLGRMLLRPRRRNPQSRLQGSLQGPHESPTQQRAARRACDKVITATRPPCFGSNKNLHNKGPLGLILLTFNFYKYARILYTLDRISWFQYSQECQIYTSGSLWYSWPHFNIKSFSILKIPVS